MKPTKHESCNGTLVGQPPHIPNLYVKMESDDVFNTVSSFWKPTEDELRVLIAGGCVQVCVLGKTHPPISVRAEL